MAVHDAGIARISTMRTNNGCCKPEECSSGVLYCEVCGFPSCRRCGACRGNASRLCVGNSPRHVYKLL